MRIVDYFKRDRDMSPPPDTLRKWRVYVSNVTAEQGAELLVGGAYDGTVYSHYGVWHDEHLEAHIEAGVTIEVTLPTERICGFKLRLRNLLIARNERCAYVTVENEKGFIINA